MGDTYVTLKISYNKCNSEDLLSQRMHGFEQFVLYRVNENGYHVFKFYFLKAFYNNYLYNFNFQILSDHPEHPLFFFLSA